MKPRFLLPGLALGFVLQCTPTLAVELLRDLNTFAAPAGSNPIRFTRVGNFFLFTATDSIHGSELWSTDGTAAGTQLVADIKPGPQSSNLGPFTVVGDRMFFGADDGTNGQELWVSDGTTAGTHLVANLTPDHVSSGVGLGVAWNGRLVVQLARTGEQAQLWRSDGTLQGTTAITQLTLTGGGGFGLDMVVFGSRLYFVYSDGVTGEELWSTDGTAAGTREVADIRQGAAGSAPFDLRVIGSSLYFAADDGVHGTEPWVIASDGAQPQLVADLQPGAGGSGLGTTYALNGAAYVSVASSQGTEGTYRLTPTGAERIGPYADKVVVASDRLYLFVNKLPGLELWISDGSAGGTHIITTIGTQDAGAAVAFALGSRVMFVNAFPGSDLNELWTSDGTVAGTFKIDLPDAIVALTPSASTMFATNDARLYFATLPYPQQSQVPGVITQTLWSSDGTQAGTVKIAEGLFIEDGLSVVDGKPFVSARIKVGGVGTELYTTDGTAGSLTLLKDINTDVVTAGAALHGGIVAGASYYFSANANEDVWGLWRTDGTDAGTVRLTGPSVSVSSEFAQLGTRVLFAGHTDATGFEPWISDGTPQGTAPLADLSPGPFSSMSTCHPPPVVHGRALINIFLETTGLYVYATDGTLAGTQPLFSPGTPFATAPQLCEFAVYGGDLYFALGNEIWKTDGTLAGTSQVYASSLQNFNPHNFAESNGLLYFIALDGSRRQLWRTDGTAPGTQQVTQLTKDPADFHNFTPLGAFTLFRADCGGGPECSLYRTDGTAAGTVLISDKRTRGAHPLRPLPVLNGRAFVYGSDRLTSSNRALYSTDGATFDALFPLAGGSGPRFVPTEVVAGRILGLDQSMSSNRNDLVRSDGTDAGTVHLATFPGGRGLTEVDGFFPGFPQPIRLVGQSLVFEADDGMHGDELWVIRNGEPSANVDTANAAASGPTAIPVLANDGDFDGTIDPTTVQIVSTPASGTVAVNATTGVVTYQPSGGFGGTDEFTYTVRDNDGKVSNVAAVTVWVARVMGETPAPPTPPTPPGNPGGGGSSGGGGGGAVTALLLLCLLAAITLNWYQGPMRVRVPGRRRQ